MSNERTIGKPTSPDANILHRPKSVNYLQGFWTTPIKRWWKQRNHTLTIKIRWLWVLFIMLALWPHPQKTVYGDPITSMHTVRKALPLPQTALQPVAEAQPVQVTASAPVVAPTASGCVSYFSGDYYLDNIIRYESGGNSCATNPGDCFGLLQACPGAPLRTACGGSPACQIDWFQTYKTGGRSWAQVWQHELDFGWW